MKPDLLRIPAAVRAAAAEGNALVKAGFKGGTALGLARGRQLADGGRISMHDAMIMRAWFARHYFSSRPTYMQWLRAAPDRRRRKGAWKGAVAWLIWGGDAAYKWILSDAVQDAIVRWGSKQGKRLKPRVPLETNI
tara:strand:+ start:2272 stop:2679 length:408 start_codon:yes stop_codon:yes gene_type:complete